MVALNQKRNPPTSVADSALEHRKTPPDNNSFPTNRMRSLLRARYYNPHTAEFASIDPYSFDMAKARLRRPLIRELYHDGMSLYRGYFLPNHVDFSGKKIVDTGVQFCRTGGVINHAFVKVCGKGFGFYAQSHLGPATAIDNVCTLGFVGGQVIDYDHVAYPVANCTPVLVDDRCIDPDCYTRHICNMANWHVNATDHLYNVLFYNCNNWAVRLIHGIGINALPDSCKKDTCPWRCIAIHHPGPHLA